MDWRQGPAHLPAQPVYVLRGHTAQVHAVHFLRQNLRLLSGDADGWVVLWKVPIKRAVAVWRAHKGAVLGLESWDDDRIITHGRDNRLCVWHLRGEDEGNLSTTLPIENSESERKDPWLLHSLPVNALNFCSFATCRVPVPEENTDPKNPSTEELLVAVPGVQDGHINVTSLPSEERVATILDPKDIKTGMVMAIGLHYPDNNRLHVIAGYESGYVCIFAESTTATKQWQAIYTHISHSQPVLSLNVSPLAGHFYSSSADDILARHLLTPDRTVEPEVVRTKHAGQQSLAVRPDGRIFATAGWDGRVRVYSAKTMKELAVLKWHKEGVYAVAFATGQDDDDDAAADSGDGMAVGKREMTVSEQRVRKTKETHWLAAGSKDGKVSLWDVY
ncbi:Astra associated protein 1 Asa1 [Friedmanniomyces endolithicus]|nr:Astra associated protein 1 Asa1 [Friedmanniomyces endolithicus]